MATAIETRMRVQMNAFDDSFRRLEALHRILFFVGDSQASIQPNHEDLEAIWMLQDFFMTVLHDQWEQFSDGLHKEVFPLVSDFDRAGKGAL